MRASAWPKTKSDWKARLKELGLYTVKVHLHSEVDASLKVWVVPTVAADEAESATTAAQAGVAELADALDLGSSVPRTCRFKSCLRY